MTFVGLPLGRHPCYVPPVNSPKVSIPHHSTAYYLATAGAVVTIAAGAAGSVPVFNGAWTEASWGYAALASLYLVASAALMLPLTSKYAYAGGSYFFYQAALYSGMEYLAAGKGMTWLVVMPLVSQALVVFPPLIGIGWAVFYFSVVMGFKLWVVGLGWHWQLLGPLAGSFAFVSGFALITRQAEHAKAESDRLARELEEANAQLRLQASQLADLTREQERSRVARELHDSLGHGLTSLAVQLEVVQALPDKNHERALLAIDRSRVLAQSALQDVRDSVSTLRASALRPLPERIAELVALDRSVGLAVDWKVVGNACVLPPDVEQALYRSCQEGLTNVRRHSGASHVDVVLDFSRPAAVSLSVVDNGTGTVRPNSSSPGFGLSGLRERLAAFGGRLDAGPCPSGGFKLSVEVSH